MSVSYATVNNTIKLHKKPLNTHGYLDPQKVNAQKTQTKSIEDKHSGMTTAVQMFVELLKPACKGTTEGHWDESRENGYGIVLYEEGEIYQGEWKNGEKDGGGKNVYDDGSYYEGAWMNGQQHGKGRFVNQWGDIGEATWQKGKLHGAHIVTYHNGRIVKSIYEQGRKVSSTVIKEAPDFVGIGIGFNYDGEKEYFNVTNVGKGMPADIAGLKAGDIIDRVDGVSLKGVPLKDVPKMIMGPAGTTVTLTIIREGVSKQVPVQRGKINAEALHTEMERSESDAPSRQTVDADVRESSTEAYNIQLHRPAKAGDKFRIEVTARRGKPEKTASEPTDGMLSNRDVHEILEGVRIIDTQMPELKVNLDADVEVVETDATGNITQAALKFNNLFISRDGVNQPDPNLPLIGARLKNGKVVFEKNGLPDNHVERTIQEALSLAIDIIKTGDTTPDELYGTTEEKKVSDTWAINTHAVAKEFGKVGDFPGKPQTTNPKINLRGAPPGLGSGASAASTSITGIATLHGKTRMNTRSSSGGKPEDNVDCLEIGVDLKIDDFSFRMPGFTSKGGWLSVEYLVSAPIHPKLPLLSSIAEITINYEVAGAALPSQEPYRDIREMEIVRETRVFLK